MPCDITIDHFDRSETEKLLSFLQKAYFDNPRQSDRAFWNWHFAGNPLTDENKMPIWVAKSGDEIAGQLAAIPVEINVGGEQRRAMWILDFIVAPEFRRQGLGKRLVKAAESFCPLMLGVNTYEQHSPGLLKKLGWKVVKNIPRYYKMLFPGEAMREISGIKIVREVVNAGFAPFRPRLDENFLSGSKNLKIIDSFDDSFDILWREASRQWSCAVTRDAKMLEWQYLRQPQKKFDILAYYSDDRKLLGYAVLFFRRSNRDSAITKAALTDICYHPRGKSETIDFLLRGALQLAIERRAGGLVTDVIDAAIEEKLKAFGFRKVKSPLLLMVKTDMRPDLLYDSDNWYLTRGDSDISIFEDPNT